MSCDDELELSFIQAAYVAFVINEQKKFWTYIIICCGSFVASTYCTYIFDICPPSELSIHYHDADAAYN